MRWARDAGGAMVPDSDRGRFTTNVPHLKHLEAVEELAAIERPGWKPRMDEIRRRGEPLAADGLYYRDTISPAITADFGQITLSTTSLMILNPAVYWSTKAGYWTLGKRWKITMFGKITTVLTPGNLTIEIRYGTTDNAGTILATSAASALTASKTNISWHLEAFIHARAQVGTTAGLFAWGLFHADQAGNVLANTVQPVFIPAATAAAVNVDTTVASGVNIQMKRSGSTAETITVQDLMVEALN